MLSLILSSGVLAQSQKPKSAQPAAFSTIAARISDASDHSLTLVSASRSGAPQQLIAHPETAPVLLPANLRTNAEAVGRAAAIALESLAPTLGFTSSALLTSNGTIRVGNVWQTTFTLYYNGIPVRDRSLHFLTGALTGKMVSLNSTLPIAEPLQLEAATSAQAVTTRIKEYLGEDRTNPFTIRAAPKLVYVDLESSGEVHLCYETTVAQDDPSHVWRITVDAQTGDLIAKEEQLEFFGDDNAPAGAISGKVTATVHPHSPYDSLVTVGLPFTTFTVNGRTVTTDANGNWSLSESTAPLLISTGFANDFTSLSRKDGTNSLLTDLALSDPYTIAWTDANSNAAERDAYYSVNVARAHVRAIDPGLFKLDSALSIFVNLSQTCNAFYDPGTVSLNFFKAGNNCSNTGEVADVVYHEFGHRVMHARYEMAGTGNLQNGSLNEGFADVTSAFIRDNPKIGNGFYSNNKTQILRTIDNTKSYPKDLNADVHLTGLIVAGAIWDVRKLIGLDTTEKLFHMMGYLAPDGPNDTDPASMQTAFLSTLMAMLVADDDNNNLTDGTPHATQILDAFAKHKITLSNFISINPEQIPDQDSLTESYPVHLTASYHGGIGALDAASLVLHFSTDKGKTYATTGVTALADSHFVAFIPHVRAGSIVSYYVSGSTTLSASQLQTVPVPAQAYSFMVGFRRVYFDDCENDNGWMTSLPGDSANTGFWVRGVPNGTFNIPGQYIQQDTDHSASGTMCYVTGNAQTTNPGADDVDAGQTTLTSPRIDLTEVSNPVMRYYYFYSNDQGSNPGLSRWVVQISNDDGQSWKSLQTSTAVTSGWTSNLFRVSDVLPATANMRLRFIASDYIGSIVEAGVDDIEVLSAPPGAFEGTPNSQAETFAIGSPYPNPAGRRLNSKIQLPFSIATPSHVTLVVKNVLGEQVATLVDQKLGAGDYTAELPLSANFAPGVYWVVLSSNEKQAIRKIVISE